MQRLITALLLGFIAATSALGLVINGGSGTGQTTAPGSGVPWDNVGSIGGTTGIYLGTFGGSYWALRRPTSGPVISRSAGRPITTSRVRRFAC